MPENKGTPGTAGVKLADALKQAQRESKASDKERTARQRSSNWRGAHLACPKVLFAPIIAPLY